MTPVTLAAFVDRTAIVKETTSSFFVVVEITGSAAAIDGVRAPLAVVFAVDASGSMKGPPVEHALASVESMLGLLGESDALGVVAFSDSATEVMPLTRIDADARRLCRARLPRVVADGYTNVEAALRLGAAMLGERQAGTRHAVILLSDGAPNRGAASPDALGEIARELHGKVALSTLGYGASHNEDVLAAVADGGGGMYAYVPDPVTATSEFARVLGAQGDVAADGLELTMKPRDGVEIVRIVGRTDARFTSKGVTLALSDAREHASQWVAIEVRAGAGREAGPINLLDLTLAYRAPHAPAPEELAAVARTDVADRGATDPKTHARVLIVRSQEERGRARALADRGQLEGAAAGLRAFLKEIEAAPGYVAADGSPLSEAYEQLVDEAMAYERAPSSEEYAHFRRAQQQSSLAASDGLVASYSVAQGAYGRAAMARSAGPLPEAYLHVSGALPVKLAARNTIGRTASADVVIASSSVSRRHAEVFAQDGRFWLADLGSTNTTRVNGEAVVVSRVPLNPGDVITVGHVDIKFTDK